MVRVDVEDGVYWGYCNEAGRRIEVPRESLQRYRFAWEPWAALLRRKNGLDGVGPVLGAGALFVGSGTLGGREYGLVTVAPGCRRAADVVLPEGARESGRPLVALLLGEPLEALPVDATVPGAALGEDLATIDGAALDRALDGVPITVPPGDAMCLLFSRDTPRGKPIDDVEYRRLHDAERKRGFDLFIDRIQSKVWCKGQAHLNILDSNGRSKGKKLGPMLIGLLADYVRRPGVPMIAKATPTYRNSNTSARGASNQLGEVRRTLRGESFLRTGARADRLGETPYYFDPGDMTWCLLEPLPAA
ncbi:MAG: hypothetical protein P8170_02285 [Gemmatimonadota bacterium]